MSRRAIGICAAMAALGPAVGARPIAQLSPQAALSSTPIAGIAPIARAIAPGDVHRYTFALAAGEFVTLALDQRGIDVVAETRDPNDVRVGEFEDDIAPDGREAVELLAESAGRHTILVSAAAGSLEPGAYTLRITSRRAATDDDRAAHEARVLSTRATALESEGRFDEARQALERALARLDACRGRDDLQGALIASQLAGVYRNLPDAARSEAMSVRALPILEAKLGADHPTTAYARSRLGLLYQKVGRRAEAETLLRRSMDALEPTLGANSRWYVTCLVTLANLRSDAGDRDQELQLVRRGMAILEEHGDVENRLYAALLNNLGEAYRQANDEARAEEAYQRSLEVGTRVLGADNYYNATTLGNLGVIARERKDYGRAEAYYRRALAIRERVVGPDHPDVAQLLNNLAIVYKATGDSGRALETHLRALHIWEHAAGPYQQATLVSVGNIARTYAAMGDTANAIAYQRRADTILEKEIALNLAIGSERQKVAFIASVSERFDRTISLHLNRAPSDADAAALAAEVLLQRKGRVLDAMIDSFAAVRQRLADPDDQALVDRLRATTSDLARLALTAPDTAHADERRRAIAALEETEERLEAELSRRSAEFRAGAQPVTLEAVEARVPDDAALVEFAVFRPFDPTADRNADAYGPPHYAAYVLRRHAVPRGFDLGEAAPIDDAVAVLRQRLGDPARLDVRPAARRLDEQVMRPLRAALGPATRLLIAPDGSLNLVPFEALVDERGRYLIERHAISYLTSGRDLLRMAVPRASRSAAVIVADPLFGEPSSGAAQAATAARAAQGAAAAPDLSALYFAPLAASAEEARAIKTLFPDANVYTGARATKAILQQVDAPRMLHIASHGFFLAGAKEGNPLVRSGLALAGANLTDGAHGNGILTALEASSLNLWGTQLVTLSACDTGMGEVRNREGVFGLRRALVLAGAETLVMSLWPITDSVARETMVAYYTGLQAGLGRGDALRRAKLAMLARSGRRHPFYWASFVQSGEWAPLEARE